MRLCFFGDRLLKKYLVILCCMICYFIKICDVNIYYCLKLMKDILDCVKWIKEYNLFCWVN